MNMVLKEMGYNENEIIIIKELFKRRFHYFKDLYEATGFRQPEVSRIINKLYRKKYLNKYLKNPSLRGRPLYKLEVTTKFYQDISKKFEEMVLRLQKEQSEFMKYYVNI
jgi:predicted transcriptional regulator